MFDKYKNEFIHIQDELSMMNVSKELEAFRYKLKYSDGKLLTKSTFNKKSMPANDSHHLS